MAALRVSEGTAKAYYEHEGVPVIIRYGKAPQTTKPTLRYGQMAISGR